MGERGWESASVSIKSGGEGPIGLGDGSATFKNSEIASWGGSGRTKARSGQQERSGLNDKVH